MSLIIVKPADKKIPKHLLEKCFENNPNGIGFAFSDFGKLSLKKTFTNFDNFYEEFLEHEDKNCLIHFVTKEFSTCKKNVGPFFIHARGDIRATKAGKSFVLAHVGKFSEVVTNKENSTGFNFLKIVRQMFFPAAFGKFYLNWILEEAMPPDNRLVILNNDGNFQIFNEKKGLKIHDCWFSETPYYRVNSSPQNYSNFYSDSQNQNSNYQTCIKCKVTSTSYVRVGLLIYCHKCDRENNVSVAAASQKFEILRQSPRPNTTATERIPEYLKKTTGNDFLKEVLHPAPVGCVNIFDLI